MPPRPSNENDFPQPFQGLACVSYSFVAQMESSSKDKKSGDSTKKMIKFSFFEAFLESLEPLWRVLRP